MTGHQVNSLVSDLVLMAKAMEELPQVQERLNWANRQIDDQSSTIQRLELKLIDAKNIEDSLRSAIRDLEVARDDAELRFLEADDKLQKASISFHAMLAMGEGAIKDIAPPKPEPALELTPHVVIPTSDHVDPSEVKPPIHGASTVQPEPVADTISAEFGATLTEQGSVSSDPITATDHTSIGSGASISPVEEAAADTSTDPEPTKYLVGAGGWSYINPAWQAWRDGAHN